MKLVTFILVLVNLISAFTHAQQQFQCQSEGFFVDPNDCSKFIRCVDTWQTGKFQVYNFDCPDGKLQQSVMLSLIWFFEICSTSTNKFWKLLQQVWNLTNQ